MGCTGSNFVYRGLLSIVVNVLIGYYVNQFKVLIHFVSRLIVDFPIFDTIL